MKQAPDIFRYARHIIAFTIILGSFGFLYMLVYRAVPISNKDALTMAAGGILALLGGVGMYYFGSSKDKSDAESSARQEPTDTKGVITTITEKKSEVIETMKPDPKPEIPK